MTDFVVKSGDSFSEVFSVKRPDGTAVDLTGAQLWLTIKRDPYNDEDADAEHQGTNGADQGVRVLDATEGRAQFYMTPTEVRDLPINVVLYWDCQIVESDGNTWTVDSGTLIAERDVTRAAGGVTPEPYLPIAAKGTVADIAARDELQASDGMTVFVLSQRSYYVWHAGAAAWQRLPISDPYWATQSDWYLDANGDDENDGATQGTAIATVEELRQRLLLGSHKLPGVVTVHLLSDFPNEELAGQVDCKHDAGKFEIVGDIDTVVLGPGALTGFTQFSRGAGTASRCVLTAPLDFSATERDFIKVTSGANAGARAVIQKGTNGSVETATFRKPDRSNPNLFGSPIVLSGNETIEVVRGPRIKSVSIRSSRPHNQSADDPPTEYHLVFQNLTVGDQTGGDSSFEASNDGLLSGELAVNCKFDCKTVACFAAINCSARGLSNVRCVHWSGGGFHGDGNDLVFFAPIGAERASLYADPMFTGCALSPTGPIQVFTGLGGFDTTGSTPILSHGQATNSLFTTFGELYGANIGGPAVELGATKRARFLVAPTATGGGGDIDLAGVVETWANLAANGIVQNANKDCVAVNT